MALSCAVLCFEETIVNLIWQHIPNLYRALHLRLKCATQIWSFEMRVLTILRLTHVAPLFESGLTQNFLANSEDLVISNHLQ
jgi:hypothetical protein